MKLKAHLLLPLSCCILTLPAGAISITIDYTYDTTNFFGAGNPDGAAAGATAKSALEAAAQFYTDKFTDDFLEIVPSGGNTWTPNFLHPGTGTTQTIPDLVVSADTVMIYAGGRSLAGSTLGTGGGGGWSGSGTPSWLTIIGERGEGAPTTGGSATEYAPWGGSITFDNDTAGQWWYNHTSTAGLSGKNDFYSVALHELGHVMGFGTTDSWNAQHTGPSFGKSFTGVKATAENGGVNPLLQTDLDPPGHFKNGTMSTVFQDGTAQEAAMDPSITTGERKLLTELDMAAFADIGWNVVPEPSSAILLTIGLIPLLRRRR